MRSHSRREQRARLQDRHDVKELFGAGVIGFQVGVGDRPCRGDAALMVDDSEVLRTHAKHRGAVHLGLSTDKVGLLWVEVFAVLILPGFLGVIRLSRKTAEVSQFSFSWGHIDAEDDDEMPAC